MDFIERIKANVQIPNLAEEIGKGASKYYTVQLIEKVIFVKHVLVMSLSCPLLGKGGIRNWPCCAAEVQISNVSQWTQN
jgi:hypothetical protein